jgi:O-antigen/teichoic acid export membrane protein
MLSIGRATSVALTARVLTMLLGLAITALLSRLLLAAELAAYWIALSCIGLVVLVAQTSVGQVAMSEISQAVARGEAAKARDTAANAMGAVFLAGVSMSLAVILVLLSGWLEGSAAPPIALLVLVFVGGALCSLAMQVVDTLRSHLRMTSASLLASQPATGGILPSAIIFLGLVAISFLHPTNIAPLTWVCILFLTGWSFVLVFGMVLLRWSVSLAPRWFCVEGVSMIKLMHNSLPVMAGSLAMFAITQADLWFVYRHVSAQDAAAYGIAAGFVKYVSAVNVLLGALLPGLVGRMWAQGEREQLQVLLVNIGRLGSVAAALIVCILALFGVPILEMIVGQAYVSAWAPLMALSVGHMVNSLLGYSQVLLITTGQSRSILVASVIASSLTLLALSFFTPRWGALGAACASAMGVVTYNALICVACIRATGIHCHAMAFPLTMQAR